MRVSRLNPVPTASDARQLTATTATLGAVLIAGDVSGSAGSLQVAGLLDRGVTLAVTEIATPLDVGEGFTGPPRDLRDPLLGGAAAFVVLSLSVIADQICTWTLTKSDAADGVTGAVTVDTQTYSAGGGSTWREYVIRDARYVTVAVDVPGGGTPLGRLEVVTMRRGVPVG